MNERVDNSIDYNRPIAEHTTVQLQRFAEIQKEHAQMARARDLHGTANALGFAGELAAEILRLREQLRLAREQSRPRPRIATPEMVKVGEAQIKEEVEVECLDRGADYIITVRTGGIAEVWRAMWDKFNG